MSVFTHGVTTKGKPRPINHNQVFTVVIRRKLLRWWLWVDMASTGPRSLQRRITVLLSSEVYISPIRREACRPPKLTTQECWCRSLG